MEQHSSCWPLLAGMVWLAEPKRAIFRVDDRPTIGHRISTRCTVRCDELVKACEEHERLHPSCSVVNICFEEKLQCEALCRARAMLNSRVCS